MHADGSKRRMTDLCSVAVDQMIAVCIATSKPSRPYIRVKYLAQAISQLSDVNHQMSLYIHLQL